MDSEKEVGMEDLENIEPEPSTPAEEAAKTEAEEPTETDLAKDALEATKPKEDMVPATVVATQRAARRAAELEAAELRGRLDAQTAQAVPEKHPLVLAAEKETAEKGYAVSTDEVVVDGKLHKEIQAYDKKQDEAATHKQNLSDFKIAAAHAQRTMTDEVHGEGLGLVALQELGADLIDDLDQQRIFRAGKDCGKVARRVLQIRILEAGGKNAKELKQRMKTHKDSQAKPKEKPGKPEQEETPSAEEVEVESDAHIEHVFDL